MQICALCSRYSQSTCPVFKEPDDDGGKRLLCEAVCRLGYMKWRKLNPFHIGGSLSVDAQGDESGFIFLISVDARFNNTSKW